MFFQNSFFSQKSKIRSSVSARILFLDFALPYKGIVAQKMLTGYGQILGLSVLMAALFISTWAMIFSTSFLDQYQISLCHH